ncbi:KTSC domain-containing protein [Bradyrhizobium sp. AZCC 1693]|uniref:KTSC domain-containing protein n=1 Tax=Bradyrhizobium sp. AZCC 1693 TaxID=3117029 RepID=UPI002FF23E32
MTRLAFILALLFTASWQEAETVDVRDRGPVDLRAFTCQDVTRSSIIARVCYDDANQYMLIQRNGVYDHYCELPKAARDALLNAPSMGQYFKANIKATGSDENGPYDCRTHKVPSYQ